MNVRTVVTEAPDGTQILVTIYDGTVVEVATRPSEASGWGPRVWGPPLEVIRDEVHKQ